MLTMLFALFLYILLFKVFIYSIITQTGNQIFGGGNDSEYYHSYAIGQEDLAVNIWPVFLYHLNEIGLYSRRGTSITLALLGYITIPLMCASIATTPCLTKNQNTSVYWLTAISVSLYPTVIYYTTDIYRDVAMLLIFLIGLRIRQWDAKHLPKGVLLLVVCITLYVFRPYLGFAFACALAVHRLGYSRMLVSGKGILFIFVGLNLLHWTGALDPLITYRGLFLTEMQGGSNLGISFESSSAFLYDFLRSISFQLFGLHFSNTASVIAFTTESIPFSAGLVFLLCNKKHWNSTVYFLLAFSIIYACIWTIGNDNLGTAVRLRIFNYTAMAICAFMVLQRKHKPNHEQHSDHFESGIFSHKL